MHFHRLHRDGCSYVYVILIFDTSSRSTCVFFIEHKSISHTESTAVFQSHSVPLVLIYMEICLKGICHEKQQQQVGPKMIDLLKLDQI